MVVRKELSDDLSENSKEIICKILRVNDFNEVINMNYKGGIIRNEKDKQAMKRYGINPENFYSEKEWEERINRVKELKLPGDNLNFKGKLRNYFSKLGTYFGN